MLLRQEAYFSHPELIKLLVLVGWKPWSSGYGRRLTFKRLWVQIPAPKTGCPFFPLYCCKLETFVFIKKLI